MTRAFRSILHGELVIWPALVMGLAAAVASLAVGQTHADLSVEVALASMTTFLFGVLLAFTIARTRERMVLIRELISEGNAALRSIHQMMAVFPEPDRSRIRDLVDRQLTTQIDYRLQRTPTGWKIYDINMMGAWLIEVYRRQFGDVLARRRAAARSALVGCA